MRRQRPGSQESGAAVRVGGQGVQLRDALARSVDMILLSQAAGATVREEMGTFRVDLEIENPAHMGQRRTLKSAVVDTGAELSWVPASVLQSLGIERLNKWLFRQADGTILERWTGAVLIYVAGKRNGGRDRVRRATRSRIGGLTHAGGAQSPRGTGHEATGGRGPRTGRDSGVKAAPAQGARETVNS